MKTVLVSLGDRSYPIFIERGSLNSLGRLIRKRNISGNALVVSQKEVLDHYQKALHASLASQGFEPFYFVTPKVKSSEATKSQKVFLKLLKKIASVDGQNKSIFLIAFGGGVIGDLAGFAASVYRRGIPCVQVPTTLTAQVDSAIGGKTGIDLPEGKNLIGSIYQPALVVCDPDTLKSLPDRHWSDGFAEVIKYGVIKDPRLFGLLEKNGLEGIHKNRRQLEEIIHRCAGIKAKVVEQDEWDKKGVRVILNFGHTAGHAIEAAAKFSRGYTHGEAVAIGMLVACDIARKLEVLEDEALVSRIEKTLIKFNLPVFYKGLELEAILRAISYDKKQVNGANRFVLPVSLGKVKAVSDIPMNVVIQALERRKG